MILLIDNYDSFTFNLYQSLATLGAVVDVVRHDAASAQELLAREPAAVVLSPGPGAPKDAGVCLDLLEQAPNELPILGVCLGHQCLVEASGGRIVRSDEPLHGRTSRIHHDDQGLLRGLPSPFPAARYHSLVADRDSLPECLELSAWTEEGHVMGVRDVARPRFGLQFHPESFLSPRGSVVLARFLERAGVPCESGGLR